MTPQYPTPVTDQREMAGWMAREEAAYQRGRAEARAVFEALASLTNRDIEAQFEENTGMTLDEAAASLSKKLGSGDSG